MKKVLILIVMFFGILITSCGTNTNQVLNNNDLTNVSSIENKNEIMETEESNPYFCVKEDTSHEFEGQIFFDCFGDIPIPECKTVINFAKIAKLKKGVLYHFSIDPISGLNIPEERLSVGYFYVQKDKIIRLWESDDNAWGLSSETLEELISSDKIPSQSEIVCQENAIKDSLKKNQSGWHQYLIVNGNRREFHSYYKHPQSIGYWESFTWEKERGLISYKSGYRDGIDYFELTRMN